MSSRADLLSSRADLLTSCPLSVLLSSVCPPVLCLSWGPQVRGAPAIAIVGCLSLAVELRAGAGGDDPVTFIRESLCHLTSARPTAVNMGRAARELMEYAENESMEKNSEQLRER